MRVILTILICCYLSAVYGEAWPTYHGGPDLQGFSTNSIPVPPKRIWSFNTLGRIETTPVSDGAHVFVSPGKGRIVALSPEGTMAWEKSFTRINDAGAEMPLRFEAPLLCHDGLLLAGSSRGILLALDAESGEERWRLDIEGILLGSPNILDGHHIVLLDQGGGALHCVDVRTGKVVWTTAGVERCDGSPGVGNGVVVFGSCLAALHVYDIVDGHHIRDIAAGDEGQIAGGVAVSGKQAFCGTRDGRLLCVNLDAGTIVWTSDESTGQTFSTPAIGTDRVVYTSDNGLVYAVDRKIGRTLWKYDTGGMPGSPVIAGDKVLVSTDGELLMLKLADGTLLWKQEISDDITSPALINGGVIVGADDGTVSAWGGTVPQMDGEPL